MALHQRVDKTLVTSGTEVATVAALTAGDYVVLVHGKSANTPLVDGDKFQVVVGKQNGTVKYSDSIKTNDIKSVRIEKYEAPVSQVITITTSTPVAGQEYQLNLLNKSDKEVLQRRQDKYSYVVVAAASGETADTLAAKFIAEVNANPASPAVASGSGPNIVLTAKTQASVQEADGQFGLQNYIDASMYTVDIYGQYVGFGTRTYTTDPDFGNGTFAQVRTYEAFSAGYDGENDLNRRQFPVRQPSYDSIASQTYDIITIEYDNKYFSNSVAWGKVSDPITLILAVEAGGTTDLEAIFANYIVD